MQQASDFLAESETLEQLIAPLQAGDFGHPTGFKFWTYETIMRHLHFWNHMANLALAAPGDFQSELKPAIEAMMAGKTLPDIELAKFPEGGLDLVSLWQVGFREVALAYEQADPANRVSWVGPSMSARSSITARQMETWAHGLAIADELGIERTSQSGVVAAEYLQHRSLPQPSVMTGLHHCKQHRRPRGKCESKDQVQRRANDFHQVSYLPQNRSYINDIHRRELSTQFHKDILLFFLKTGRAQKTARCILKNAWWKKYEKIWIEVFPLNSSQIYDFCFDRFRTHPDADSVSHLHSQGLRPTFSQRDHRTFFPGLPPVSCDECVVARHLLGPRKIKIALDPGRNCQHRANVVAF